MEEKPTKKRDFLLKLESEMTKLWETEKTFEVDAPDEDNKTKPKYFATFPYPYMNGRLHLGHTFTLSKVEFAVGYQALKGRRTLLPFAFHCTGMPIKACADKLTREMESYGVPPLFCKETEQIEVEATVKPVDGIKVDQSHFHSAKAKTKAKTVEKYQWEIMEDMGVEKELIKEFADASYWLKYFPPLAMTDLKRMGVRVDWRRSFTTTDDNPYYDSFIRWQYLKLRALGLISYGKRNTIYSPKDGQACADHDRATGEGVLPQEYILIKQELCAPFPKCVLSLLPSGSQYKIFLVPATLRPETVYGQTNTFVLPDGVYGLFDTGNNELFICSPHSARNLAYQGKAPSWGVPKCLGSFTGAELIGMKVTAPLSIYKEVYVLPMMTISTSKGTGIVTSVPGDAPDDYAALIDLKKKKKFRDYFGVTEEMLDKFPVVPIISVPGYGNTSAVKAYEEFGVQSQNDAEKLKLAKEKVYLKGFYEGEMLVGDYKGFKVKDAKRLIKKQLISSGNALKYSEPESVVISRSGDVCVSAMTDQWYLNYHDRQWKANVTEILSKLNTFGDETRHIFENTLSWLKQWGCSRTYGLGTKLPFDEKWRIESLSDSTIYMAYYTVAHLLQSDIHGKVPGKLNIVAKDLTEDVWDYVFFGKQLTHTPGETVTVEKLDIMRKEFLYWYPLDLRVSGKDLIPNHLTFMLYHHQAIFGAELSPRAIRANGHLLLNNEKMSKSTGTFLTLNNAMDLYSVDAMRFALADAGDSLEDANFLESTALSGMMRLYSQYDWMKDVIEGREKFRKTNDYGCDLFIKFWDDFFITSINVAIKRSDKHYENLKFRKVLKSAFYDLQAARDQYRLALGDNMNESLVKRFIEVQLVLLSPICPHYCDYVWRKLLGKSQSILVQTFPNVVGESNEVFLNQSIYLQNLLHTLKKKLELVKSQKKEPKCCYLYVTKQFPAWKVIVVDLFKECYNRFHKQVHNETSNPTTDIDFSVLKKEVLAKLPTSASKSELKQMMGYVAVIEKRLKSEGEGALKLDILFNEKEFLDTQKSFIQVQLEVEKVEIYSVDTKGNDSYDPGLMKTAAPFEPSYKFVC